MARLPWVTGLCSIGLFGCGADEQETVGPDSSGLVKVTGLVTDIDDDTPVDGGVVIKVTDPDRGQVTLGFESLYTRPPPTMSHMKVFALSSLFFWISS